MSPRLRSVFLRYRTRGFILRDAFRQISIRPITREKSRFGKVLRSAFRQISLEENFVDAHAETNTEANYTTLGTTHSSAKMEVKALEFALALGDLWSASSDEEFPTTPIPVYVRLKAELTNSGRGIAFSNVIELPKVLGYKAVPPLELPSSIFINGSMAGSNWSNWVPLAAVN